MELLSDDKIIDLSELFKIFGDSTRVKIINILIDRYNKHYRYVYSACECVN